MKDKANRSCVHVLYDIPNQTTWASSEEKPMAANGSHWRALGRPQPCHGSHRWCPSGDHPSAGSLYICRWSLSSPHGHASGSTLLHRRHDGSAASISRILPAACWHVATQGGAATARRASKWWTVTRRVCKRVRKRRAARCNNTIIYWLFQSK